LPSAFSKVDSKGRVLIPIKIRAKLKILEGSRVRFLLLKDKLILLPENQDNFYGQSSVRVSTEACGASRAGSSPASDPKKVNL